MGGVVTPVQLLTFGGLSLAAHLAVFAQFGGEAPGGAGEGGMALATVQAASPAIAALVEEWETPPETARPVSQPAPPRVETARLDVTEIRPQTPRPASPLPPVLPETAARPEIDSETAPHRVQAPAASPRPAARAEPVAQAAAAQPQHRAAGSGARSTTGAAAQSAVPARAQGNDASQLAAWSAAIQSRIARQQRYPRGDHGEGRVRVAMVITRSGALTEVGIAQSSGRAALDRAAIQAVRRAAPFPPAPLGLSDDWYRVAQWMAFRQP